MVRVPGKAESLGAIIAWSCRSSAPCYRWSGIESKG
jgi:hypothetical protein